MTDPVIHLRSLAGKTSGADSLRGMIPFAAGRRMAMEVGRLTGAPCGEKSPSFGSGRFPVEGTRFVWCGRGDSNPHGRGPTDFLTRYGFRRHPKAFGVWTIPSPFSAGGG